ncbi:probable peptidyl-tRNA hydrolase isoform X1 [Tupaia chinensis]|uniref:probable peptidyl-tRNA hydrolase isoform X1 n=1 Tax=Tupaia chinensis TaxID=246437 RepID=UPI000FFB66C4|nr:probable peptidyl-tRNA hydrolase isoform X1 [Tupaia chinensis]
MPPSGLLGSRLWLSRAMSRCVLEPRPPGKRWLVAGLGNPGLPSTRHSVGMAVLGQLARRLGVAESWERDRRCAADLALAPLGDAQLVLLRPRRLMNANGRSVARAEVTMESVPVSAASTPTQCRGCEWASGAPRTLMPCRPTCWAASPPPSKSCCLHCWIVPPTFSWTTSGSAARNPLWVLDSSGPAACPPAEPSSPAAVTEPHTDLWYPLYTTLLWAAPGHPQGTVARTVHF